MKKRFAPFLVCFITFLTVTAAAGVVFAQEEKLTNIQDEKIRLLYKMGITESEDISENSVSRGEFATWLAALSGIEDTFSGQATAFSDVPASNKYASAVSIVSQLGCMNGVSETEFAVNDKISRTDASVALLRLIGYELAAQSKGGYPDGYNAYALSTGLTKYTGNVNDRAAIMIMCANALTVPGIDMYGERTEENQLLNNIHDVYKVEDIVTGNRFTVLGTEEILLAADEIEIGSEIYVTEDITYAEYLGEYVRCYYYYDRYEQRNYVVSMEVLENRTEKTVISAKDIVSAANNTVTYEKENKATDKLQMRSGFEFIYNNRVKTNRTSADLKINDGELTLIDTDNDGKYDIAKAMVIETMVFQGVDNFEDLIYCKEDNLYTDPFDDSYYCEVFDVDEKSGEAVPVTIDELTSGDVLTVYRSHDSKYLSIYAYSSTVSGIIKSLSDEKVEIDDVEYDLPLRTPVKDLVLGAEATFSTDMFGRLVYVEISKSSEPTYGYFFNYGEGKGMGEALIKILDGNEIMILPLADKVAVDDTAKYDEDKLEQCSALFNGGAVRQLIRYTLNSKGEVKEIYTAAGNSKYSIKKQTDIDKNKVTKYYPWHDIYNGKYILPDENFFLVIPDYENEADNEELYGNVYNNFSDDINDCYVEIYDVNDDMEAGAVLLYSKIALEGVATTTNETTVGVFIKGKYGSDGPIAYIYSKGEEKVYTVNDTNIPSLTDYRFGDVIRFVVGKDGRVTTIKKVLDIGTTGENTPVPELENTGYTYRYYFGRVYSKQDNHLVIIPNENNLLFDDSVEKRVVIPNQWNRCMLVDMNEERIISASYDNVARYLNTAHTGGCYVYARVYKFQKALELIVYKF